MASRIRIAVDRMTRVVDDMLELQPRRPSTPAAPRPPTSAPPSSTSWGPSCTAPRSTAAHPPAGGLRAGRAGADPAQPGRQRGQVPLAASANWRCRLAAAPRDGVIEIVVEDNGMGMDAEAATHAFEPYYRGESAREVPGHGLGLAIVERATRAARRHLRPRRRRPTAARASPSACRAPDTIRSCRQQDRARGDDLLAALEAVRHRQVVAAFVLVDGDGAALEADRPLGDVPICTNTTV